MRRTLPNRARRGERGASQIEFALTLIIVMMLLFFIWELCMVVYAYTALSGAAHEGVRFAIVHSNDTDGSLTKAHVVEYAKFSMQRITESDVTVTFPDGDSNPPNRVRVRITYTYVPFTRFFTTAPTLKAYAEGRVVF
jgi:Flp pilus assembly protein TadG